MESEWLPFGVLRRAHGTSGEIPLIPFNGAEAPGASLDPPVQVRLVRGQEMVETSVVACRPVHEGFLVRFEGIESREAAAALSGHELHLPRAAFDPLQEDEFYVEDMVGCEAFDSEGRRIGQVTGTFWNGAQDVMTIVAEDGSERLLPVVAEYVLQFEPEFRRLVVDLHE